MAEELSEGDILRDGENYNEQSNSLNRVRTYLIIKLVSIFSIPIFTISWMKSSNIVATGYYEAELRYDWGGSSMIESRCNFFLFREGSASCSARSTGWDSLSQTYAPNFEYLEYALNISLILISVMFSVLLMNIFKKTNTDTKSGQFGKFIQNKSLPNGFTMVFYFVSTIVIILTTYSILQIHRFSGNNGLDLKLDVTYYLMVVTALWMFSFSLYLKKSNTNTHTLTGSLSKLRSKSRDEIANGENLEIAQSENALPGTTIIYNITDSVISGDINNPIQGIEDKTIESRPEEGLTTSIKSKEETKQLFSHLTKSQKIMFLLLLIMTIIRLILMA